MMNGAALPVKKRWCKKLCLKFVQKCQIVNLNFPGVHRKLLKKAFLDLKFLPIYDIIQN